MPRHQRPPRRNPGSKRRPEPRSAVPARHHGGRQGQRPQPETVRPLSMEDQLLLLLHGQGGSAPRQEFARGLKPASRGEQRKLDKLLDYLCRDGLLACDGETFSLRPGQEGLFEATFHANPRGFGFVTPVDSPPGRENDVFIPAPYLGSAAHGDRVLVRVEEPRRERPEGRIIKVLNRGATQVVGVYRLGRVFP